MSFPVRMADGTLMRIGYKRETLFKSNLGITIKAELRNGMPLTIIEQVIGEDLYIRATDPNDIMNVISSIDSERVSSEFANINNVTNFLYGHTIEELSSSHSKRYLSSGSENVEEEYITQKEWNEIAVENIDYDYFLASYYTLLCSANEFSKPAWKAIFSIIKVLNSGNPRIWNRIKIQKRPKSSKYSITELHNAFKEFITLTISKSLNTLLSPDTAYILYANSMHINDIIEIEDYNDVMLKISAFLDQLALSKINELINNEYDFENMNYFNVDDYYFFKDTFSLKFSEPAIKDEVNEKIADLYLRFANSHRDNGRLDLAKRFFDEANEITVDSQKLNLISDSLLNIKPKLEAIELNSEKEYNRGLRLSKLQNIFVRALMVGFLIAIISIIAVIVTIVQKTNTGVGLSDLGAIVGLVIVVISLISYKLSGGRII